MKQTKGKCYLCHNEFSKQGMLKHINGCKKRDEQLTNKEAKQHSYQLLKIEAKYNKNYWLFIYIKDTCELWDLDIFLRAIWLECCGHLSQFRINGEYYEGEGDNAFDLGETTHGMDIEIRRVFKAGMRIDYEYDFGSTTELTLQVCKEKVTLQRDDNVILLARNNKPEMICDECNTNPASYICMDYCGDEPSYRCETCLDKHEDEEEMIAKYVNSPRTGVCGYEDDVESIDDLEHNMNAIRSQMQGFYTTRKDMDINRDAQLEDDDYFSMDDMFGDNDIDQDALLQDLFDEFGRQKQNQDMKYLPKLTKKMKEPVHLKDVLLKHTKDELKMCAEFFEITIDNQIKKGDLVDQLANQLPKALVKSFAFMDEKVLGIYKATVKEKGKLIATNLFDEEVRYQGIWIFGLLHQIYLRIDEYAIDGEELMGFMPKEILTTLEAVNFQEYTQSAKRNFRVGEIVEALTEAYGVVSIDTIQDVLSNKGFELNEDEIVRIVNYAILSGRAMEQDTGRRYKNQDLTNANDVLMAHFEEKRIPFKQYTENELAKPAMMQAARNIKEVKAFEKYMKKTHGTDNDSLEELMDEVLDILRDETDIESYFEDIAEMIDFNNKAEKNTFRNRFMRMAINVPTWYLKGHSIAEADRLYGTDYNIYLKEEVGQVYSMATKRKIGRNEPCPCGSGKKYKHCCGK